ncbi:MAG: Hpt domain-containing protein [Methylocystaceae bacterium]|nr:Hpt domain-containing protein [Methylocystaceae bacterium]
MVDDIPNMDAILAQMKDQFLDTAIEKINLLNEILKKLSAGNQGDQALQDQFRREVHSLKGMGGTFQVPLVTEICQKFELYLEGETHFNESLVEGCHQFIGRLTDLINNTQDQNDNTSMDWIGGLPLKNDAVEEAKQADSKKIVVLVIASDALANDIKVNFVENDFEVIVYRSAFAAFEYAFMNAPAVFIITEQLGEVNGAEILRALHGVKSLSRTTLAMVCADRREALKENLKSVHLLSEKNIDNDIMNFISIIVSA